MSEVRICIILKHSELENHYSFQWKDILQSEESIITSKWELPKDLQLQRQNIKDGTLTTLWITGGMNGEDYTITNHVTTNKNRKEYRTLIIRVDDIKYENFYSKYPDKE